MTLGLQSHWPPLGSQWKLIEPSMLHSHSNAPPLNSVVSVNKLFKQNSDIGVLQTSLKDN